VREKAGCRLWGGSIPQGAPNARRLNGEHSGRDIRDYGTYPTGYNERQRPPAHGCLPQQRRVELTARAAAAGLASTASPLSQATALAANNCRTVAIDPHSDGPWYTSGRCTSSAAPTSRNQRPGPGKAAAVAAPQAAARPPTPAERRACPANSLRRTTAPDRPKASRWSYQHKTSTYVWMPAHTQLRVHLSAAGIGGEYLLTKEDGTRFLTGA
jgi:hypothetical protein